MATNETVDIDLNVKTNLPGTIADLKQMKKELKTIKDDDTFKKKQQEIEDLEDALRGAKTGAGNFAEVLGQLPGPLGQIGSQIGGTLQSLKQFGALKFTDIKSSFVELGKDILDAGTGFLKLTGITKLYTIVAAGTAKVLRLVGIEATTASFGVKAFSAALVASGIGAIVVALGFLISSFMNTGDEADTAATKVARLNAELQNTERVSKLRNAEEIARAKKLGATETELFNIKQRQTQEELDLARKTYKLAQGQMMSAEVLYGKDSKGYADAQKLKGEAAVKIDALKSQLLVDGYNEEDRLRKEGIAKDEKAAQQGAQAVAKRKQERDKEAADKLKTLEEITKNERAAALSLLDDREQEKRKIVNDYNEQIKLAADNGKETFILEEAKLKALGELKDKYQKEDTEKAIAGKVQEYENLITDLDFQNQLLDDDYQADLQRLANKEAYLAEQKTLELSNTKLTLDERNAIIQKYAEKERQIDKDTTTVKKAELQARQDLQLQYADVLGQFGSVLSQAAGENKALAIAGLVIEQAAGVAKIIVNTQAAASKAGYLTPKGIATLIAGGLGVASAVIATKKGIDQINKVNIPGGGASAGASTPPPTYGGALTMATPQITGTEATTPGSQIAQTIAASSGKPVRAYVVSSDISSQQALDRKTNRGATFGQG